MSAGLKAVKQGHDKLKAEVAYWESEIEFFATAGNVKAQRKVLEQLQQFEIQNASRLKAIKEFPFLAK